MHICPVCGYPGLSRAAYRPSGEPSHGICRSCGFEFGYTDDDRGFTFEQWREKWIAGGMMWRTRRGGPPPGWDPRKQLLNIGVKL